MKVMSGLFIFVLFLGCASKKSSDSGSNEAKNRKEREHLLRNAEAKDRRKWLAAMKKSIAPKGTRDPGKMPMGSAQIVPQGAITKHSPATGVTEKLHKIAFKVRFSNTSYSLHMDKVYVTDSAIWVTASVTSKGRGGRAIATRRLAVEFGAPDLPVKKAVYGSQRWAGDTSDVLFFTTKEALLKAVGKASWVGFKKITPASSRRSM